MVLHRTQRRWPDSVGDHANYDVKSCTVDGDNAIVSVEITNYDMTQIMSVYISELFAKTLEYAFLPEEEQPSEEEMEQIYSDLLSECLSAEDVDTVTSTVDADLVLVDSTWKLDPSDEFIDALFGGAVSYFENWEEDPGFDFDEPDSGDEPAVLLGEGQIGDSYVIIKEAKVIEDYDGTPVVVVTFDWTNNSDETTSAWMATNVTVFQDGVSLDTAYVYDNDDYDSSAYSRDVRPGVTIEVQQVFELINTTSPIEVEIEEAFSWDAETVVYQEFPLN